MSDFSRTFKPAGTGAATGSDYAWGSDQFVVGGSVTGKDFYASRRRWPSTGRTTLWRFVEYGVIPDGAVLKA